MRSWIEYNSDIYNNYGFWSSKDNHLINKINSISMETVEIYQDNTNQLREIQAEWLRKLFNKNDIFKEQKLLIFAINSFANPVTRIMKYNKLWRSYEKEIELSWLNKVYEGEINVLNGTIYYGVGEFNKDNFYNAIDLISKKKAVIISSDIEISDENIFMYLNNSLNNNYPNGNNAELIEFDYEKLCLKFSSRGDLIFRLGNNGEEESLAIFFDKDLYGEYFKKIK